MRLTMWGSTSEPWNAAVYASVAQTLPPPPSACR